MMLKNELQAKPSNAVFQRKKATDMEKGNS
jgi:hypothetical protein